MTATPPDVAAFAAMRRATFYPKADLGLHADPPGATAGEVLPMLPRLCAAHLGAEPLRAEPLDEAFTYHRIFAATLPGDREVIARFNAYSHRTRDLALHLDREAADRLNAIGLPAVEVFAVDLSRSLCPWDFALMQWATGVPLKRHDHDDNVVCAYLGQLGSVLAKVHDIDLDGFGLLTVNDDGGDLRGSCGSWPEYLANHLDRHLDVCGATGAITVSEAWAIRGAFASARLDGVRPALLHGDPGGHNVFVEGGRVTALIDWEDALAGDPAYDLAFCASFHPPRRYTALFEGYFAGRRPDDGFWGRFWLYFLRVALAKTVVRHNLGLTDVPGRPPASRRIQWALGELTAIRSAA